MRYSVRMFKTNKLIKIILSLVLVFALSYYWGGKSHDQYVLITAKKIINSEFNGYLVDNEILIKNHKIVKIGKNIRGPKGTKQINLPESIIIPGLIDAHTHITFFAKKFDVDFSKELVRSEKEDSDIFRFVCSIHRARSYLKSGITSIRDVGNCGNFMDMKLKKLIDSNLIQGPQIYGSGPGIATHSGQFPENISDETVRSEYTIINDSTDIQRAIDNYIYKKVDLIKVYPGNSPGYGAMSSGLLEKIVKYAHSKGLKVAAHAEFDFDAKKAALAGVDSIEHGYEISVDTLKTMSKKDIYLIPTDFSKEMYKFIFSSLGAGEHDYFLGNIDTLLSKRAERIKQAIDNNVKLAFGSDMFFYLINLDKSIGRFSKDALVSYVESGVPVSEVLKMATINAAKLIDNNKLFGVIKEGAQADIIAVRGDPLRDIKNLDKISFVMKNGRVVSDKCWYCFLLKYICS